eukprot:scaffold465023_cov46-Prasinocladus_malaysianus.AAC.1
MKQGKLPHTPGTDDVTKIPLQSRIGHALGWAHGGWCPGPGHSSTWQMHWAGLGSSSRSIPEAVRGWGPSCCSGGNRPPRRPAEAYLTWATRRVLVAKGHWGQPGFATGKGTASERTLRVLPTGRAAGVGAAATRGMIRRAKSCRIRCDDKMAAETAQSCLACQFFRKSQRRGWAAGP